MESKKECINVSVRIRPTISQDNTNSSCLQIISNDPPVLVVLDRPQTYHFDNIFSEDTDQKKVYDKAVRPLIENVKKGFNCTVFAYGQTGTGKTYTMGTDASTLSSSKDVGIIPRALEQLFSSENETLDVYVSFTEIYNEKVFDLLQTNSKNPLPVSGFVVQGLSVKNVRDAEEAKQFLRLGNKNRHTGETSQNANSSRSHAIFTVHYKLINCDQEISGKLNLVDLAGSEGVKKTGSRGSTFQEGININKGLLSVGQVISALSMRSSFIPYRQSVITSILQGSLNVDNYVSLIACANANPNDVTETLQTLDFAQRAKKIKSNPEVNQIISKYKKENIATFPTVRTPLKRPNPNLLMQTQSVKRVASQYLMPSISESHSKSEVESSNMSVESSVASVNTTASTNSEVTQQAFSPVIRKYINKLEVSLMDHFETFVKKTIETAQTPLVQRHVENNKENTPMLAWNKIQNEVSKLVRSELAQMTVKTIRATSSPLNDADKKKIRRVLSYDSPEIAEAKNRLTTEILSSPYCFKVPAVPVVAKGRRPKKQSSTSGGHFPLAGESRSSNSSNNLSISPIEAQSIQTSLRRSTRLSIKNNNNNTLDVSDDSFNQSKLDTSKRSKRKANESTNRSIANASKRNKSRAKETSFAEYSSIIDEKTGLDSPHLLQESIIPDITSPKKNPSTRRINMRLAAKKNCVCLNHSRSPKWTKSKRKSLTFPTARTPSKAVNKRIVKLKSQSHNDSPYTAHSKKVLTALNNGTLKEIEKLHSIGTKTAEQIMLFRKLKGSFSTIEDLIKVPGWGTKRYERFVSNNFLKKDC